MNYNLTAEQDMIVRSLRAFREQEFEPYEAEVDRSGEVLDELGQQIKSKVLYICASLVGSNSLVEIDINPLMITPHACIAADVMIRETTT